MRPSVISIKGWRTRSLLLLVLGAGGLALGSCSRDAKDGGGGAAGAGRSDAGQGGAGTELEQPAAVSKEVQDANCDGVPEGCTLRTYDATENLLSTADDVDCDGTGDIDCRVSTYDENNHETSRRSDLNCDGAPEGCRTWTYDAGGFPTGQYDEGCDGTPDPCISGTVVSGNREVPAVDADCDGISEDGVPETCSTTVFDVNGYVTGTQTDDGCDGVPDICSTQINDAHGNPTIEYTDFACTGTPSSCSTLSYDANGNKTSQQSDGDCDGVPEDCSAWIYDPNGTWVVEQIDYLCDGAPEYIGTYDANGRKTSERRTTGCGRWLDVAVGDKVTHQWVIDCTIKLDDANCNTWTFDTDGNETNSQYDADCDGTPESSRSRTYFTDGTLATEQYIDVSLAIDECRTNTQDNDGNLIGEQLDIGCDGIPDSCTTTTWDYSTGPSDATKK